MTKIGIRMKELRIERDLTMDLFVADMNPLPHIVKPAYLLGFSGVPFWGWDNMG